MKRTFLLPILLLLFLLAFVGCDNVLSQSNGSQSTNGIFNTNAEDVGEDTVIRIYGYIESEEVVKPSIILFEDNKCQFTFSAYSSYSGIGTYTIEDDFLILNTSDGNYTYTFRIEGDDMDRLIFLAEKSSEYLHLGKFEDGAVFASKICLSDKS